MDQLKIKWYLRAAIALLCLISILLAFQVYPEQAKEVRWEYMVRNVEDQKFEEQTAYIGANGWEAVSARRASNGDSRNPVFSYEIIFKRSVIVEENVPLRVRLTHLLSNSSLK